MTIRTEALRRIPQMLIFFLLLMPALAQANPGAALVSVDSARPRLDVAAHSEYLLDTSRTLRYEDIVQDRLPFQRHDSDSFNVNLKKGTLWIKCRIRVADAEQPQYTISGRLFLAFDSTALALIRIYVPVIENGVPGMVELKGGRNESKRRGAVPFLYTAFVLPGNIDATRPVVIRIANSFAVLFRITLYTFDAFQENGFILILVIGFCVGILVAMLLYNLVLYLYMRDKHYLFYILYVFFLLVWQCEFFGLFQYFWPSFGNLMFDYIVVFASSMMFFAIIFAIVFLNTEKTAPIHDVILKILAAGKLFVILISLLNFFGLSNLLAYILAPISTVAAFTAALASLRSGFKPALYYLIAAGVLLIASTIFICRFYGLLPNNMFTMHAMLFGGSAEAVLLSFALGNRIRMMRQEEETLRIREKNLQAISITDELTGLFNRRFLNASLNKAIAAARRSHSALSVLMMDVDRFKDFNDTYSHPEGDKALAALGRLLTQTLRGEDIACRYGGEEFVTILHNTDLNMALDIAERIRSHFEAIPFNPAAGRTIHATVSIGVAQLLPDENPDQILLRADQALYRAKQSGRNRVCSA